MAIRIPTPFALSRARAVLCSALATVLIVGYGASSDAAEQPLSNRRMAALLDSIATEADFLSNSYLNHKRAAHLAEEYARMTSGARSFPPSQEVRLRTSYGRELVRAGQPAEGILQFEHIQRMLEQSPELRSEEVVKATEEWLAVAHLRLGMVENDLRAHNADSSLLPVRDGGIHRIGRGARTAIEIYSDILRKRPDDIMSIWLMNLAYMFVGEYPDGIPPQWLVPPKMFAPDYDVGRYRDVAPGLGLDVISMSGGVVMEDLDGDGALDIMTSSSGHRDQVRFFRSNGYGTFTDHTDEAGLTGLIGGLNMTHADFDNDGNRDVMILRGAWQKEDGRHPNSLLRNEGDATFVDITEAAGLLSFHPTHSAPWGDYDNDGWLDMFMGHETANRADGTPSRHRHPSQLFRNNRDGTFSNAFPEIGIDVAEYVKAAAWGDYDNDGMLDLYVSNQGSDNILLHNLGNSDAGWQFTDVAATAGVREPIEKSFPTWFWDYDNDGWQDILVAGFGIRSGADIAAVFLDLPSAAEVPRLYHNNGDGTFDDVTEEMNLTDAILVMGANFGDLDNDGYLDCYFGNGFPNTKALLPNVMYRNAGGEVFQNVTYAGSFGHLGKGHGIAFGDLDHDGDQDIYQVQGGAYSGDIAHNVLYENPGHGNRWIVLLLEGVQSNRDAFGARIRVRVMEGNAERDVYVTAGTGGSFGSSSLQQEIGLGQADHIELLEITWPATGQVQTFSNLAVDQFLKIREGDPVPVLLERKSFDLSPSP